MPEIFPGFMAIVATIGRAPPKRACEILIGKRVLIRRTLLLDLQVSMLIFIKKAEANIDVSGSKGTDIR